MVLDRIDRAILKALANDGRVSWRELAERVNLSLTPVLKRVQRLEKENFITGYSARIDEARLGGAICVFVSVQLESQTENALAVFEQHIFRVPEVMSCHMMTGSADYLLRVIVHDLEAYQAFLVGTLTRIPGVSKIQSSFALKSVVQRFAPPL
jgi:Lrp/AsnC family transcriptional regulator, leucine-responsive regulatory protein